MAKKQKKGDVGKGTGADTRKAIRSATKKGCTLKEIGRKSNRSASTLSQILSGDIKNPPSGLASQIRKASCKKKKR